jgi:alkane 1-monooxygenase
MTNHLPAIKRTRMVFARPFWLSVVIFSDFGRGALVALRFCGALLFIASIPLLYYVVGGAAPLVTFFLIPVILIGADFAVPRSLDVRGLGRGRHFRLAPYLYIPAQAAVTVWGVIVVTGIGVAPGTFISLALAIGICAGVFGMLAAHEMIHSHSSVERALGLTMLTAMSYRHFRVAHIHGHHRYAATERDAATARLAESFYAFLARTVARQFLDAWQFETARRKVSKAGILANRVFRDVALLVLVYVTLWEVLGLRGVFFFALQSALAIVALELFNYVAHYGLIRAITPAGQREPFTDRHSWNASNPVGNALLFNMGRHSDHHRYAAEPYQALRPHPEAPELPAGYAGAMMLALIPPLWRKVMDIRVVRLRAETPLQAPFI